MDWKKLAFSGVMAGSLLGIGCGGGYEFPGRDEACASGATPPCETTVVATDASARTVSLPESMADETRTWVVGTISIPEAGSDGRAAGFNLDGLNSGEGSIDPDANCEEFTEDYTALFDPNHVGVDNALQSLVSTIESLLPREDCPGMVQAGCLDATLQEQINSGSLILMVEVTGINDYVFDDAVQLQLVLAEVPDMGTPMVDGSGGLAAGQTFNTVQELGTPVAGDIFQGRLRAQTDQLTITIDTGDFALPLMISGAEVRFDLATDGSTLSNGVIGGFLRTDDIVNAASMIMEGIEDTVRGVVENVADVSPSAADPQICDSVSVGLTFEAVGASRN